MNDLSCDQGLLRIYGDTKYARIVSLHIQQGGELHRRHVSGGQLPGSVYPHIFGLSWVVDGILRHIRILNLRLLFALGLRAGPDGGGFELARRRQWRG